MATTIGMSGDELKKAETAVSKVARIKCCHLIFRMAIREYGRVWFKTIFVF
jgi:hypothetical protein